MRLGGHRTTVLLLCSSDADDDNGFFGFLVSVDVGDVDNESVGVAVAVRSIFCIAIVLLFFGDDVVPDMAVSVAVEGDASILLFNKGIGHP